MKPPLRMPLHPSKPLLWAECALLCVALPLLFVWVVPPRVLFGVLWVLAFYALWVLKRYHGESLRSLWQGAALNRANLQPVLLRFALCATLIGLAVWQFLPQKLFAFPQQKPQLWAMVMLFYPLLSVIPQEIVFRPFFFRRYAPLFPSALAMLLASAITFGFAHVMFQNYVAVALCVAGGWLFASTYQRTGSLAVVWLEHALYGCFIFTIGLGYYFYHGSVQVVQAAAG